MAAMVSFVALALVCTRFLINYDDDNDYDDSDLLRNHNMKSYIYFTYYSFLYTEYFIFY